MTRSLGRYLFVLMCLAGVILAARTLRAEPAKTMEDIKFADKVEAAITGLSSDDDQQRAEASRKLIQDLGRRAVPKILEKYPAQEAHVKLELLKILSQWRDPRTCDLFRKEAGSDEIPVKVLGLRALGELADKGSADLFLQALESDLEALRNAGAFALSRVPDEKGIPGLARVLALGEKDTKLCALQALGEIGTPAAFPAILQALKNQDADVREYAAGALWKCGDGSTLEKLRAALKLEQDVFVKASMEAAVQKILSRENKPK